MRPCFLLLEETQGIGANHDISMTINSTVLELHAANAAAALAGWEMWNANSSLAEICLCSLALIRLPVFFIDSTTGLVLHVCACLCVCICAYVIFLILFHALGKALLARKVHVLVFFCFVFLFSRHADKVASLKWAVWPVCERGEQMHFSTAFDLWVNNLRI